MTNVTNNEYYGVNSAVRRVMQEQGIERVEIYELYNERKKIKEFGVNWSAIGTVDIETTNNFIEGLQKASKIVEYLNRKEFIIKHIDSVIDYVYSDGEMTKQEEQRYLEFIEKLYNELINL